MYILYILSSTFVLIDLKRNNAMQCNTASLLSSLTGTVKTPMARHEIKRPLALRHVESLLSGALPRLSETISFFSARQCLPVVGKDTQKIGTTRRCARAPGEHQKA